MKISLGRNAKRLLLALISSAVCFGATVIWFNLGPKSLRHTEGQTPVARLDETLNEVQRREAKRVIWETVGRNDELFSGERVRTTVGSEAQIFLVKSGTVIHLDPESEVVIEDSADGLAVDFLSGNLFVQGGGSDHGDVKLKTGAGEVSLGKADVSLSKSMGGSVDLEVLKGEAELEQNGRKLALARDKSATFSEGGVKEGQNRMRVLSPEAGETRLLNLAKGEALKVAWVPLPKGYRISLELGATRNALKSVGGVEGAGEAGQLSVPSKAGRFVARLRARANDPALPELVSSVFPFTIEPKDPPRLVSPANAQSVVAVDGSVSFRWISRNHFVGQHLEISRAANFQKPLQTIDLAGNLAEANAKLEPGKYFWRVTGTLESKLGREDLTSAASAIEVVSRVEVRAATLLQPPNRAKLSASESLRTGVALKWQTAAGTPRVHVLAELFDGKAWAPVYDQDLEVGAVRLSRVKPGRYRWKVLVPEDHGPGKVSAPAEFTVDDLPRLAWTEPAPKSEYLFPTPAPTLAAHWQGGTPSAETYRFRVAPRDQDIESAEWRTTKQPGFEIAVAEEGDYHAAVEALDRAGQPVAESILKEFSVKRLPLLPGPRWGALQVGALRADGKGNLSFGWEPVDGAKQYLMILRAPDGHREERAVRRATASVERLRPGRYQVELQAVDAHARPGELSAAKTLEVPATSSIGAPKVKAVKVK